MPTHPFSHRPVSGIRYRFLFANLMGRYDRALAPCLVCFFVAGNGGKSWAVDARLAGFENGGLLPELETLSVTASVN
jgi:hypothetical protein